MDNNSSSFHTDNYKNSVLFLGGGDMFVIEPNLVMCACGGGGREVTLPCLPKTHWNYNRNFKIGSAHTYVVLENVPFSIKDLLFC